MFSVRRFIALLSWTFVLVVNFSHGSEIINGHEVKPHSLPFMALLETDEPVCGGTLIDLKWVLTAAHCEGIKTVTLGVHSIKAKIIEKKFRQFRNVKRSFPHPSYDKHTKVNDLMLLQLDNPVRPTKWVKVLKLNPSATDPEHGTICLVAGWGTTLDSPVRPTKWVNVLKLNPSGTDPEHGTVCLVAGWGTTDYEEGIMSDVLMSVNVTVVDRKKCNSAGYYNKTIYSNMMCAGSNGDNVADTCQGDSGGPIICNGAQVGVTSFGAGCGIKHKPGVYALLTEDLLNWIKMTMKRAPM